MFEHHFVPQGTVLPDLMTYTFELTLPSGVYQLSVKAGNPFGCSEDSDVFPASGIKGRIAEREREREREGECRILVLFPSHLPSCSFTLHGYYTDLHCSWSIFKCSSHYNTDTNFAGGDLLLL